MIIEALAYGRPAIVRDAVWSAEFESLPVLAYSAAVDLGEALERLPRDAVPSDELAQRFNPADVVDALEAAARRY